MSILFDNKKITLTGGQCEGDDVVLTAHGQPPFSLELNFPFSLSPSDPPSQSLSLPSHSHTFPSSQGERKGGSNYNKKLMFRLKRDSRCEAGRESVQLAEVHPLPTASLNNVKKMYFYIFNFIYSFHSILVITHHFF